MNLRIDNNKHGVKLFLSGLDFRWMRGKAPAMLFNQVRFILIPKFRLTLVNFTTFTYTKPVSTSSPGCFFLKILFLLMSRSSHFSSMCLIDSGTYPQSLQLIPAWKRPTVGEWFLKWPCQQWILKEVRLV